MTPFTQSDAACYYDRNTAAFLRLGGSRDTAAIHRRIWAPGVTSQKDAFLFLNRLVADAILPSLPSADDQRRVLDLGCGVGGTSTWIAAELGISVAGITNSQNQVRIAVKRSRMLGLSSQCSFFLADFHDLPEMGQFQAAWAVESFVHASDPASFFNQVAACLVPGGRLVICDDFLADSKPTLRSGFSPHNWLERFKKGWRIPNLITIDQSISLADQAGFRVLEKRDLTPWLRPFPQPVLWLVSNLTRIPLPFSYWDNLAGGSALQVCQQNGWTKYHALIFEKP